MRITGAVTCALAALVVAGASRQARPAAAPWQASPATDDPVAVLDARIRAGEVTVASHGEHGYLEGLLDALAIPVSSQGLVFSRTSLQTDRIGPWAPRALYFNDDVYIGAVQDSPFLEIASIDPDEGARFYTVAQDGGARPVFERQGTTCLMCHESKSITAGVPGVMVLSVVSDRLGYVIAPLQEGPVTDRTPFDRRLGGYYVTGTHGAPGHAGNTKSTRLSHEVGPHDAYVESFDRTADGNVTTLEGRFDVTRYLTPHSDLVALLVLAHQTRVHNLITLVHEAAVEVGGTPQRLSGAVDRLVREMLFAREAPLPGPVRGTSAFAREFAARGPRDDRGRSLRDLDLDTRLFRYPLSFLIYSAAFDALPAEARDRVYDGIDAVLTGRDTSEDFAGLTAADRTAIREILVATKPGFAARDQRVPDAARLAIRRNRP
ncbi:MAG: hypothetical protein R2752_05445 [Vicinamibacterales bacterium]